MIDWFVEEILDLVGVQVDCYDLVGVCGFEQVGDQLCGDWFVVMVFFVLLGIWIEWYDGGDLFGVVLFECVDYDQLFYQLFVYWCWVGLQDEGVVIVY